MNDPTILLKEQMSKLYLLGTRLVFKNGNLSFVWINTEAEATLRYMSEELRLYYQSMQKIQQEEAR